MDVSSKISLPESPVVEQNNTLFSESEDVLMAGIKSITDKENTVSDFVEQDKYSSKEQYDLPELNSIISENGNFDVISMIALTAKDKFDEAVFQLQDRASYDPVLVEINQKQLTYFNHLPQVVSGDMYVENIACNRQLCMGAFELLNDTGWDDSVMQTDKIPVFNIMTSLVDSDSRRHQLLFYAIDPGVKGVESPGE